MELTKLGFAAEEHFKTIEKFHPYVITDQLTVMPNHIHGIIAIQDQQNDSKLHRTLRWFRN